ncbi:hypothetical protein BVY10_12205 [Pseudomonas amygdali pv. morsprunorum]|nr:hypothetical protein BVY10_12205 [Pseudomonas amygdali pv. morsprunorum]
MRWLIGTMSCIVTDPPQGKEQEFSSTAVLAMMRDFHDFVMHVNNQLFKMLIDVQEENSIVSAPQTPPSKK